MLTQPWDLSKLLALALYRLGEPLLISEELYNEMLPVNIVLDNEDKMIKLSITSSEILIGKVDNEVVEVVL